MVDNMLWSGQVLDENDDSPETTAIREFTRLIQADTDFVFQLIPVRDGIIAALRVS